MTVCNYRQFTKLDLKIQYKELSHNITQNYTMGSVFVPGSFAGDHILVENTLINAV